jgi:hypothetical protein
VTRTASQESTATQDKMAASLGSAMQQDVYSDVMSNAVLNHGSANDQEFIQPGLAQTISDKTTSVRASPVATVLDKNYRPAMDAYSIFAGSIMTSNLYNAPSFMFNTSYKA